MHTRSTSSLIQLHATDFMRFFERHLCNKTSSNKYGSFPFPTRRNDFTDDYEILPEVLGRGVNGKVYKCQHRQTGQKCALKILEDSFRARQEIILHKKSCENCQYIVKVVDVYENMFRSKRCLLIVAECMEGGELFHRIEQRKNKPYTERDAARYIWMIVQAVYHLHKMDIAHRDLKAENLLLTNETDDAILKLTDFGFAKEDEENSNYGMKYRIKTGDYQFPDAEWKNISQEGKSIIQRMLIVNPANRITIDEILTNPWLTELNSERSIDISPLQDAENRQQLQAAIASATDAQRQIDDDLDIEISGPEASRIAKRAAKKNRQIVLIDETFRKMRIETEYDHEESSATTTTESQSQSSDLSDKS
ncbi:unnamed protein product [Rotaria sp. Silwood1]|nr:unnamed protein product [Rotaria sp. Silwood1]